MSRNPAHFISGSVASLGALFYLAAWIFGTYSGPFPKMGYLAIAALPGFIWVAWVNRPPFWEGGDP